MKIMAKSYDVRSEILVLKWNIFVCIGGDMGPETGPRTTWKSKESGEFEGDGGWLP